MEKNVNPELVKKVKMIRARNRKISAAYRSQRLHGLAAIVISILTLVLAQDLLVAILFAGFGLWMLFSKDILFYVDLEVTEDDLE